MRILFVDDDRDMRLAMERFLVGEGHSFCWSATALGALELLRTERIELVLLDLELEGTLSGIDVALHVPRRIPVFLISGHTKERIMRDAAAVRHPLAGVSIILGKPLDTEELRREIRRLERISRDDIPKVDR